MILFFRLIIFIVPFLVFIFRKQLKVNASFSLFLVALFISLLDAFIGNNITKTEFRAYSIGFAALFIGVGMLVFWEFMYSILLIGISILANIILFILYSPMSVKDYIIEGQLFVFTTAIISIVMVNMRFKLSINELKARMELENSKKLIEEKNTLVEAQKYLIEEKHKEITDSINYAERIQKSFLATESHLNENLSEYFVMFKPKDVVSGDFYWSATLNNGLFALATADSTGHGVPGAIMSLLNITSLEKATETLNEPSDILNATREIIINRLKKDGTKEGGKDGMDCSLCVFDFKDYKLHISAANNSVWIVQGNEVLEIKPDKMPVGKHSKQNISFTHQMIELRKGDVVYTLTDGFSDQFGGLKGKKFMSKNLRDLLAKNAQLPMHEQKQILEKTFSDWVGTHEQVDDVTVIGIRV